MWICLVIIIYLIIKMKRIEYKLKNYLKSYMKSFKTTNIQIFKNQFINYKFSSGMTGNKLMKVIFPKPSETIDDGEILSLEKVS